MTGRRRRLARALKRSASTRGIARRVRRSIERGKRLEFLIREVDRVSRSLEAWDRFLGWARVKGVNPWFIFA